MQSKKIPWIFHADDQSKSSNMYDMIIGIDLLTELGMVLNFQDKIVSLDTGTIPVREYGNLKTLKLLTDIYLTANEPKLLEVEFTRSAKILNVEYKPATVLQEIIDTCNNLNQKEKLQLLQLLPKYEHLFDGTFGEFNMNPIRLQLEKNECKPVYARPYTVPSSVEQQLRN
jgi:hypothetical protein